MYDYEPLINKHAAEWVLSCGGRKQKHPRIRPGIYRVHWTDGGSSIAAIGCGFNGDNWIAPTNWSETATIPYMEGREEGLGIERLDLIATQDDCESP